MLLDNNNWEDFINAKLSESFCYFYVHKSKKNSEHVQVRLIDVKLQHLFSLTDTRLSSYVRVGFIITLHSLNDAVNEIVKQIESL